MEAKSPSPFASIEKERGFVKLWNSDVLFCGIDLVNKFHTAVHAIIVSGERIIILRYRSCGFHTVDHFLKFIGIQFGQFVAAIRKCGDAVSESAAAISMFQGLYFSIV